MRSVALTFSPHPVRFLAPGRSPKLISTLDQKVRLIEETGLDLLFIAPFDEAFSRLAPGQFIREYLIEGLGAQEVCVGSNFNFGYRQQGTIQTLRECGNLQVIEVPPVRLRRTVVSSTRVRELITAGEVSHACRMLGRWVELEGTIVGGAGRGRKQTVPTLNLEAGNELLPRAGVYITRISLDDGRPLDAITNIGVRPTFDDGGLTVETFVLRDPVPDLARTARLQFMRRVRDEIKFESPEALRRQITIDIRRAERFFRLLNFLSADCHAGSRSH